MATVIATMESIDDDTPVQAVTPVITTMETMPSVMALGGAAKATSAPPLVPQRTRLSGTRNSTMRPRPPQREVATHRAGHDSGLLVGHNPVEAALGPTVLVVLVEAAVSPVHSSALVKTALGPLALVVLVKAALATGRH